jgi:hypothetical protein
VVNKTLAHLLSKHVPIGYKGYRIVLIAGGEFVIHNAWQYIAQLDKSSGSCQLGDRLAEFASRRAFRGHLQELVFETPNVDGHNQRSFLKASLRAAWVVD